MTKEKETDAIEFLTRDQAAEFIGIKGATLHMWAWRGRPALPYVKLGNRCLYDKRDLVKFLAKHRVVQDGWKDE